MQLTKLFLNSEANVNLRCNNLGWTPMHVCAYWNKADSLELLLNQKNANPFKKCNVRLLIKKIVFIYLILTQNI